MKHSKFKRIICFLVIIMSFVLVVSPILADTSGNDLRIRIPDDVGNSHQWAQEFARSLIDQEVRQIFPILYWGWPYHYMIAFHAITANGDLYAWGENRNGQLGDGTTIDRSTPVFITDSVRGIHNWDSTVFILKEDGGIWGWGNNIRGQLGDGSTTDRHAPVHIIDSLQTELSIHQVLFVSQHQVSVLRGDGELWFWGDGTLLTPTKLMDDVFTVSFNSILRYDGSLWTFGVNDSGQVGDGTTIHRDPPFNVLNDVIAVNGCTSCARVLALRSDGTLWAWGNNHEGHLGDGTTTNRYNPIMIMDDVVSFAKWIWSTMALRSDGSLWSWGPHDNTFNSPSPLMIVRNFVEPTRVEGQTGQLSFTADDGRVWNWPGWAVRLEDRLRPTDMELINPGPPDYDYTNVAPRYLFSPAEGVLERVTDATSAETEINNTLRGLTAAQRQSPDALNLVTLFIENAERRGTSQYLPADGRLRVELFDTGMNVAGEIRESTYDSLSDEYINLMRNLRSNINFIAEDEKNVQIILPDDTSGIPFDNLTVETEFAMVTLNREHIISGGEVEIRRVAASEDSAIGSNTATISAERDLLETAIMFLPAVIAILLMAAVGLLLQRKGKHLRLWVIPAVAVIAVGLNVALVFLEEPEQKFYTDSVEINMSEGMRATVSLSAADFANPENLMLFNENGELQYSKFNPVTGMIDATVRESGVYVLREHTVSFADIANKSQMMQNAIVRLAAKDIMRGAEDGYFHPDDLISRAEFVSAIVMAFDMLDLTLQPTFIDLSPASWYFHAIASAEHERLVQGFPDGTFRGNLDIPKDQLVVISASTLMEHMGYFVPDDIEYILSQYFDRHLLAPWSEEGIALATDANIVLFRADSLFAPQSNMTRGDAAIVLYRVFGRVW